MNETSQKLCQTIETFIQTAQFDALIDTCKVALTDARQRDDKATEIVSLIGLGQGHKFIGKFKQARILIDGALDFAKQSSDIELTIMALMVSSSIYLTTAFQSYEAERDLREALNLAVGINDDDSIAETLLGLSTAYRQMDDNIRASRYAHEGFNVARKTNNRYWMSVGLMLIGDVSFTAQPEKAMQSYEDAIEIAKQDNFRLLELGLTSSIGQLLCYEERYSEDGQMMLEKALSMAKDFRSVPHEFTAIYRLGRALEKQGAWERAAQYYSMMLERAQEWRSRPYEGVAFFNLGILAYHRQHYDDALANYEQALVIARETKNPFQEAQTEQAIAKSYLASSDFDRALDHYMAARTLYDALDNSVMANLMLRKMITVYLQRLLNNILTWVGIRQNGNKNNDSL